MIAVISIKKITKRICALIFIMLSVYIISFSLIKKIRLENIIKIGLPNIEKNSTNLNIESEILEYGLVWAEDLDEDLIIEESKIVTEVIEEPKNDNIISEEEKTELADTNLKTEVIENSIKENPNTTINGVKIKNETGTTLTESLIDNSIKFDNKNILIFHTHTCESYTPTENMNYVASGNYRTIDLNYSVARAGSELEKYLKEYGFNVIHDTTYHDYPAYSGSYSRSLETVSNIIKQNQEFNLVFDLHRDAIGSNSSYAPKVKIGDDYCAQIMFVIGTNQGGLTHNNWVKNLSYAIKIQEKANEMYPGLFKTMIVRNSRYNQHLNDGASIIEIGATGNTLEECLNSMKYFSSVLNELF